MLQQSIQNSHFTFFNPENQVGSLTGESMSKTDDFGSNLIWEAALADSKAGNESGTKDRHSCAAYFGGGHLDAIEAIGEDMEDDEGVSALNDTLKKVSLFESDTNIFHEPSYCESQDLFGESPSPHLRY